MKKLPFYLSVTVLLSVCLLIGYKTGYNRAKTSLKPIIEESIKYDTMRVYVPKIELMWLSAPMLIPFTDSMVITRHDTSYISVPRENKEYADSNYRAIVSGYDPSLDYIEVYNKTVERTRVVTERYKGYYFAPHIDATYVHDLSIPLTLDYGYTNGSVDASVGLGYDLMQRQPVIRAGLKVMMKKK